MEKQEIVVYDQNGSIVSCPFERIDVTKPNTILTYCDDVKESISKILETTAQMTVESKTIAIDDALIGKVTGLEDSLDESEKQKNKKQLPVVKGIKSFLARMGVEKYTKEEEMATYKGRYLDYVAKIQEVREAVEAQKQASLSDIALRDEIVTEIRPLVERMEEMINVAKLDRDSFAASIEELKTQPQSQDVIYEIQYKTQLLDVFSGKINELEKALVLYKTQIQQYRVQQNTEMQAVMSADSYIKDTVPILEAQGSVMVFNREQTQRLEGLKALNEAANVALLQNSNDLAANAEGAVELSLHNGIEISTIEQLDETLRRGFEIFQKGKDLRKQQIEEEQQALLQLNSDLDSYQQEVLNLIDDREVVSNLLTVKSSRPSSYKGISTRKPITTKKPTRK